MENECIVSIIIPVYNGTDYLKRCFHSLEHQTYRNLQVVFVNDGSKDHSLKMLKNYEQVSSFNVMIIDQENAGQGMARNAGIDLAEGKYLLFLDQDDIIDENYIMMLTKEIEDRQLDILLSGYYTVDNNLKIKDKVTLKNTTWSKFMNITPWGKIYRRSYISDENIRFIPLVLGEDIGFNFKAYSHTDKIGITEYVGYRWVQNPKSLSKTEYKRLSENTDLLKLYDMLVHQDDTGKWMQDTFCEFFFIKTMIWYILYSCNGADINTVMNNSGRIHKWMQCYFPGYLHNKNIGIGKPEGERRKISIIVWIYICAYRFHFEKILLSIVRIIR